MPLEIARLHYSLVRPQIPKALHISVRSTDSHFPALHLRQPDVGAIVGCLTNLAQKQIHDYVYVGGTVLLVLVLLVLAALSIAWIWAFGSLLVDRPKYVTYLFLKC